MKGVNTKKYNSFIQLGIKVYFWAGKHKYTLETYFVFPFFCIIYLSNYIFVHCGGNNFSSKTTFVVYDNTCVMYIMLNVFPNI